MTAVKPYAQRALDGEWCPICGADEDILKHDCPPGFTHEVKGILTNPGVEFITVDGSARPVPPKRERWTDLGLLRDTTRELDHVVAMAGSWTP